MAPTTTAHEKGTTQKVPIPSPQANTSPLPRIPLTTEEQTKYTWLLTQARAYDTITCPNDPTKSGPLTPLEKQWLSRDCLIRFLRATKFHEQDSSKRLLETLAWRREYGVDDPAILLNPKTVSPENETGKQLIAGYDNHARPCHYLNPARQNTEASPRQIQHLVCMVERVIDLMPPGQETLSLLINFKPGKRSNPAPGINIGRECLHILQMHYPERLGRALIINVPWVVWGFFKLITPFIDPRTREKLHFNEDMTQFVPKPQLWEEFPGGEMKFDYDHDTYWPALWDLCETRRAERTARWKEGGGHIGEYEDFMSGFTQTGCRGEGKGGETKEEDGGVVEAKEGKEENGEAVEGKVEKA